MQSAGARAQLYLHIHVADHRSWSTSLQTKGADIATCLALDSHTQWTFKPVHRTCTGCSKFSIEEAYWLTRSCTLLSRLAVFDGGTRSHLVPRFCNLWAFARLFTWFGLHCCTQERTCAQSWICWCIPLSLARARRARWTSSTKIHGGLRHQRTRRILSTYILVCVSPHVLFTGKHTLC